MANQGLHIDQQQRMLQHLSPQQVQFVRMLEMNHAEIDDRIRRELDENPALEISQDADNGTGDDFATEGDYNETPEQLQAADYSNEDEMPTYPPTSMTRGNYVPMEINPGEPTATEQLLAQLSMLELTPVQHYAAQQIIGNLEQSGRLVRPLPQIADDVLFATGRDIPHEDMQAAFNAVRSLEPAGIGAIDLRDCLLLQLERRNNTLPVKIATEIVDKHFDILSLKHYKRLESLMGIDRQALDDALEVIRSLNPKPWDGDTDQTYQKLHEVSPDFIVEVSDDNRFIVQLTHALPTLDVECSFRIDPEKANTADRAFIRSRREDAQTFIGLLQRRNQTLLSVMQAIVSLQAEFFRTGDTATIKPMILKDVAQITNLDISVVSRATAGKYVQTQTGIYPLKMFFNERLKDDDPALTMHRIMSALKALIDNEDPKHPLSDQALTDALNNSNLNLARRTVAKYREKMGYPVARLRKQS